MSTHRRPTGALTPIRITLALALSVAVLPFTAVSSSADEEVVEETIVETEQVPDPEAGTDEGGLVRLEGGEPPDEGGAGDARPVPKNPAEQPAEPLVEPGLEPSGEGDDGLGGPSDPSMLKAATDLVVAAVCDPGFEVGPYGGASDTYFEIDGDSEVDCTGNDDWATQGDLVQDEVNTASAKDTTNFTQGSAEEVNPSDWQQGTGTAPAKDDIVTAEVWNTTLDDGEIWSLFAFSRVATNGTTSYDVEYNQKPNSSANPPRPDRTPGDLLLQFDQKGTNDGKLEDPDRFALKAVWEWRTGASVDASCIGIDGYEDGDGDPLAAGWCPLSPGGAEFVGDVSPEQDFAEGAVNITELRRNSGLPSTCVGAFGTMNIRSYASQQETSALKDYVAPFDVNIPGTCGTIRIEKVDASSPTTRLAGASFKVMPDPTPGSNAGSLVVTDNDTNDADGRDGYLELANVEPGTYKVIELTPPAGYFLPPLPDEDWEEEDPCPTSDGTRCTQKVVTSPGGTAVFVFADRKIWEAPDVSKTAVGSYDVSYTWTIDKAVSETEDEQNPDGEASLEVEDGADATFYYDVTVTGTEAESPRTVTGTVTVSNPNSAGMTVVLSDVLNNGADDSDNVSCKFDDADAAGSYQVWVPPTPDGDDGTPYAYTCSALTAGQAAVLDNNTATVTWDLDTYAVDDPTIDGLQPATAEDYQFPSDDADVSYAEGTVTDRTINVEDEFPEFGRTRTVTFGSDPEGLKGNTYTESWTYSKTFTDVPPGACTDYDNTAWVDLDEDGEIDTEDGSAEPSDRAVATVCSGSDLLVSKVTTSSLTRTYPYTIEKSVEASRVDVDPETGLAEVEYTVVVTDGDCEYSAELKLCDGYADSEWAMVSTVTLTNPNTWQPIEVTDIDDVYVADVNGVETAFEPACDPRVDGPWTVPAATVTEGVKTNGQTVVVLDCTFNSEPPYNGTNRATATWETEGVVTSGSGASGEDPVVESDWQLTKVNDVVDVIDFMVDDGGNEIPGTRRDLGTVEWLVAGHEHTTDEQGHDGPHPGFTYTVELEGEEGACVTYDNLARVQSQDERPVVLDEDDATVDICWMSDLNVTKDGSGTFHRDYDWDVEKSILIERDGQVVEVDEDTVRLDSPDLAHQFGYRVTAVPLPLDDEADSGWAVDGTITVDNPNSADVEQATEVTITELPNMGAGASCDVADGTYTTEDGSQVTVTDAVVSVPAEDRVTVDYSCTFSSAPLGTKENLYAGNSNQVRISWGVDGEANSEVEAIAFTLPDANKTDWEVEVHDDQRDPTLLGTVAFDDSELARTFEYTKTYTGTEGECDPFQNVATIKRIGVSELVGALVSDVMAQASADAEICVQAPLEIVKDVTASYDRTYAWSIDKVANSGSSETSGGAASFRYDVTVAPNGSTDSGWVMGGTINVTNPNSEDVGAITADVTDTTTVGGTCSVVNGNDVVIDPGETVPLTYSCTFTSKPTYTGGTNTARADWVGFEDDRFVVSDPVSVSFELDDETNRIVSLTDAFDGGLPQPIAGATGIDWLQGTKTFTYTRSLGAPAGSCRTYPNTARIVETGQTDSATVTVCAEAGLQVSKTVNATFDRTYAWELEKLAGEPTGTGTGEETFEYTVTATPQVPTDGVYDDSGFAMSGVITVTNPNAYAGGGITASVTDVPNVGAGVTCTVPNGSSVQLAPGASVQLAYSCAFTGRPSYLGSNTANASWTGPDGAVRSASSGAAVVAFGIDDEVNKVIDVVDDKTQPGEAFELGTAEWKADGSPTLFTYSLDLTAEANECEEYTNTAEIMQTGDTADATVEVCGPEVLPDEVIVPEPQPRPEPVVKGVDTVIPDTGGPNAVLMWTGLALLLMGGVLLMTSRTRRSRT